MERLHPNLLDSEKQQILALDSLDTFRIVSFQRKFTDARCHINLKKPDMMAIIRQSKGDGKLSDILIQNLSKSNVKH